MEPSTEVINTIWVSSLVIGAVVIFVVAFLLHRIRQTAVSIRLTAADIWTEGKLVANNTIQIPIFLSTTNRVVDKILGTAGRVAQASEAIQQHAEGCPGCPDCILQHKE